MDLSKKRKADENGGSFTAVSDASGAPSSNLTPEDAGRILEPLSKEQLLPILRTALLRYPDVLEAVRSVADSDATQRKLFVRGLGWETNTEKLRSIFSAFGEIDDAIVITDKGSGKSKGYGFVTFKHIDGAILALKEPNKKIDGRITVTQLAAAGNSGGANAVDVSTRKIYVGNIPFDISSERLLVHFSAYGEIEEGPLGFDKQSGKAKGFAFFVYKTEEGARASLVDPIKTIDGHQVQCKLATDGKKGKPGMPNAGGVQGPTGVPGDVPGGERYGVPPPGSMNSNYGGPGGGYSSYGGYSGAPPSGMPHQNPHFNSSMPSSIGAAGGPGYGNQGPGSFGGAGGYGGGGAYGSSNQYGGSSAGDFGGMNNTGSSMYRMPPTSTGMPNSGGYQDAGNYGLSSSAYPTQHPPSTGPRVPPGGAYQGMPPYY